MSDDEVTTTIRSLGGEIWGELLKHDEWGIDWQVRNHIVELVMAVLARHAGEPLINDSDIPVKPLASHE